jgi:hypothetical protein
MRIFLKRILFYFETTEQGPRKSNVSVIHFRQSFPLNKKMCSFRNFEEGSGGEMQIDETEGEKTGATS